MNDGEGQGDEEDHEKDIYCCINIPNICFNALDVYLLNKLNNLYIYIYIYIYIIIKMSKFSYFFHLFQIIFLHYLQSNKHIISR